MTDPEAMPLVTASLFSGVAGIEQGLGSAGVSDVAWFCERWEPARAVLAARFRGVEVKDDVTAVDDFGGAALVTAGFPCTDLSQAGLTRGLEGLNSGLVLGVLEKIAAHRPDWVLLENVPNMLHLGHGAAMDRIVSDLEAAGYSWAYRVVDSRFTGLAQRRRRVFLLASQVQDPARILLGEDHGEPTSSRQATAFGFSWTEGNRGVGWAVGATPTLKGGTTVRVASPPAIWLPKEEIGRQIVRPSIQTAESLQGLEPGWTAAAPERDRWKLVGNAVSAPVARWIGERLARRAELQDALEDGVLLAEGARWPTAARGTPGGKRWAVGVSEFPRGPVPDQAQDLGGLLSRHGSEPLSWRAAKGFRDRLRRSSLRYEAEFMAALDAHVDHMAGARTAP